MIGNLELVTIDLHIEIGAINSFFIYYWSTFYILYIEISIENQIIDLYRFTDYTRNSWFKLDLMLFYYYKMILKASNAPSNLLNINFFFY